MANKVTIAFAFSFFGDGSSTNIVLDLLTAPVGFAAPNGYGTATVYDITKSLPSAVTQVSASGGLTVTSTPFNFLHNQLTVNFSGAATTGTLYNVSGYFEF